jgi:hypothetical protein
MEVFRKSDVFLLQFWIWFKKSRMGAVHIRSHPCLVRACKIHAQSGQNTSADPKNLQMPAKTAAHLVQLCTSSPLHSGLALPPFQWTTLLGGRRNTRCPCFFSSKTCPVSQIKKFHSTSHSSDINLNGHLHSSLHYPNDIDKSHNEATADKPSSIYLP